jgi:hypothetical protein
MVSKQEARISLKLVGNTIEAFIGGAVGQLTNPDSVMTVGPILATLFNSFGVPKTSQSASSLSGFQPASVSASLYSSS